MCVCVFTVCIYIYIYRHTIHICVSVQHYDMGMCMSSNVNACSVSWFVFHDCLLHSSVHRKMQPLNVDVALHLELDSAFLSCWLLGNSRLTDSPPRTFDGNP